MLELSALQKQIVGGLIFAEPFSRLLEVTGAPAPVVGAELKFLIQHRLVQVMEPDAKGGFKPTFFYDSDNMNLFYYRSTEKGHAAYHATV